MLNLCRRFLQLFLCHPHKSAQYWSSKKQCFSPIVHSPILYNAPAGIWEQRMKLGLETYKIRPQKN